MHKVINYIYTFFMTAFRFSYKIAKQFFIKILFIEPFSTSGHQKENIFRALFQSLKDVKDVWRTRNYAQNTRATSDCFHSFVEAYKTLTSVLFL